MKYLLIILAALAIVGCDIGGNAPSLNDKGRIYKLVDIDSRSDFSIFCDRSTNIAYLRYFVSEMRNGFTVYYNSKGEPARCNEIQR